MRNKCHEGRYELLDVHRIQEGKYSFQNCVVLQLSSETP